jgi:putative flippase GtrA
MTELHAKFFKFMLVGGLSTLIHFFVLFILTLKPIISPTYASAIGYILSSFVNYFLNYKFTFKHTGSHSITIVKFYVMVIFGLAINSITFNLISGLYNTHPLIIQVPTTATVLAWNFTVSHLWTYKNNSRK